MYQFYAAMFINGAFILVFGLLSLFIKEKCYISETLVATAFGMIVGRDGLGKIVFEKDTAEKIAFQFSRIVISLQVIAVGMLVSRNYVLKSIRSLLILIFPVFIISWLISTSIIYKFFPESPLEYSMIIAACLTPTDPVLSSTILKGKFANKYVPVHLRKLLTFESGANDGIGLSILNVPIYMLLYRRKIGIVLKKLAFKTILFEVGVSLVIGFLLGILSRYLLIKSKERNMIDKESFLAYTISLAFFVTGITAIIGVDDIFACFVCGVFFSWYDEDSIIEVKESHLLEVIDMLVNLTFFIFFGAVFPLKALSTKNILICSLIILFRRLPVIMVLSPIIDKLYSLKEAIFTGWFGPIGVGCVFLMYHANENLKSAECTPLSAEMMELMYLVVVSSVLIHGITVPIIHIHLRHRSKNKNNKRQVYDYSEYSETENYSKLDNPI